MTVSLAMEEAIASGCEDGVTITTAEIDHPGFEAPVRVVTGLDTERGDEDLTVSLPLEEGGPAVPHRVCPFELIRPGRNRSGPTPARLRIFNVSDILHGPLELAQAQGGPIRMRFRQYIVRPGRLADVTGPDEDIDGLLLYSVTLTATEAEGKLDWLDQRRQNVPTGPDAFFDRDAYPALFGR